MLVPRLSELRQSAGRGPYFTNIAEHVQTLFNHGKLPEETTCVSCSFPTTDVIRMSVECERPQVLGPSKLGHIFLLLVTPWWMKERLRIAYLNPQIEGRELVVDVAVRLCASCAPQAVKSEKNARKLLLRSPIYEQLFREYPSAKVHQLATTLIAMHKSKSTSEGLRGSGT